MQPGYEYLSALRLTHIMAVLQDVRSLPQNLLFANRIPMVDAIEGEIMGRFIGRVIVADLLSDDSKAAVYTSGNMQLETSPVPNLKLGRKLTQENLNQLAMIAGNPALPTGGMMTPGRNEIFGDRIRSIVDDLRLGVMQRIEQLLVAMHLGNYTYDRLGMKIAGTWGMPADLNVTPQYFWTDPVNATPVNDIWNLNKYASIRYGKRYNRMTMSTQAFMYMIATTEFQNKARTTLPLFINYANIPQGNIMFQRNVAANILQLDAIDLYDARFWEQGADGKLTSSPYLPINKVVLDNTENDGDPSIQDFANGVVTESLVSGFLPNVGTGMIGSFDQARMGPVCYASVEPALNPPQLTIWGVARGFPRRYQLQASAVLNVGTFVDQIPVTDPFGT